MMDTDSIILGALVLTVVILLGIAMLMVGAAIWSVLHPAPTFTLEKSEWKCTESVQETYFQPTMIGKVLYQLPRTREVCVNYRRNTS